MKHRVMLLVLALLVVRTGALVAQQHDVQITIGAVALLAVDDPGTPVVLSTAAPADAGDPVTGSSDSKAIFYTVLTDATTPYRITAEVDADPPNGTQLIVNADPGAGNGTSANDVTLTVALGTQNIITAIGSTATGRDPLTPPELVYTLNITDPSQLEVTAVAQVITVTLTLTD